MQTTIHGNLPGIRDHGVFTPPVNPAADARAKVAALTQRKAQAETQLRDAVAKADGKADLNALSRQIQTLTSELEAAEAEAHRQEQGEHFRRLAALKPTIERARASREEFVQKFREACIALGRYAAAVGEATELVNLEARLNPLGYSEHRNELAELSGPPRPLEGLAGYTPATHTGWDWRIPVVPLTGGHNVGK